MIEAERLHVTYLLAADMPGLVGRRLAVNVEEGPVGGLLVLLQPAPSDPFRLEEAWITGDGMNVRGTVDMQRLAASLGVGG